MKAQLNAKIIVSVFGATGRQGSSRSRSRTWSKRRKLSRRRSSRRQRPYSETFSKREKVTNWPSCLVPLYSRSPSLLFTSLPPLYLLHTPASSARLNAFRFLFIFYSNVATKMAQTLRSYLCFFFFFYIAKQKKTERFATKRYYIYTYMYIYSLRLS